NASNQVFVTGSTQSSGFYTSPGAYDTSFTGTQQAFVSAFNSTATTVTASTFLGGTASSVGRGIVLLSSGAIVIAGSTTATDLIPSSSIQASNGGGTDGFLMELS